MKQFLLAAALLPAAAIAQPIRSHDITISDYESLAIIDSVIQSPDGEKAVHVERRWENDQRNHDLWVTQLRGGAPLRVTFDAATDTAPMWAPDSSTIYFLSNPKAPGAEKPPGDGKNQVWRIAADGSDLRPVTRVEGGVDQFELTRDGSAIFYSIGKEHEDEEWADLRKKTRETIQFGHGTRKVSEIWRLDLRTWRSEKVFDQKQHVARFTLSPDATRLAVISVPDDRLYSMEGWSQIDVLTLTTGDTTRVPDDVFRKQTASPYGWLEALEWSDDGASLAFSVGWDGYPTELYIADVSGPAPRVRKLDRPDEVHPMPAIGWVGDDLYFLAESRARTNVCAVADVRGGAQGSFRRVSSADVAHAFSAPRGETPFKRRLVVVMSSPTRSTDLFLVEDTGAAAQEVHTPLTDVNPQMATWKLPQMSLVTWRAADGQEVEGVLELPPDYQSGSGPLPLVLDLHGGPTGSSQLLFEFWGYGRVIFAANGYALLSPNYRGSTGYGDKFLTDLIGRENEIEVGDILAGVDTMIAKGIADKDKLAAIGWSNGGFLVNCLITKTDRLKAASSGAGVVDQFLQWATEDTPNHVVNFMQGPAWKRAEAYLKASPSYALGNVRTPTLIHVGENDERVPAQHARALHRALRDYLNVPTQLCVYPEQGHGLSKASQRMAKMEWDLAWFNKHVRGEGK